MPDTSSSPARFKALRGALVAVDAAARSLTNSATVFAFQYNPEKLVHSVGYFNSDGTMNLESKPPLTNGASSFEFIYLTLELDAIDQLEQPQKNVSVAQNGLNPALATLQFLTAPPQNASQEPKVILFSWGPKRLLATRMVNFKVTEEAFDIGLNPIQATVDICLRVMKPSEFKSGTVGYRVSLNQQNLNAALAIKYKESIGNSILNQVTGQTSTTVPAPGDGSVAEAAEKRKAASGAVKGVYAKAKKRTKGKFA